MVKRNTTDHRTKRRIPITTAIRVRCSDWDHFQTEYSGNISEGGVFIATRHPLKPGTVFTLELTVGAEVMMTKAQVIWTKEFADPKGRPSGMGARFLELDAESHKVLSGWIDDLESRRSK